jgi:hypothetical protein
MINAATPVGALPRRISAKTPRPPSLEEALIPGSLIERNDFHGSEVNFLSCVSAEQKIQYLVFIIFLR